MSGLAQLVDSHCHLDGERFATDREAVIQRARASGVEWMVAVGTGDGPPDLEAGIRLAEAYPFVYATVGVHPHDAAKASEETWVHLTSLTAHPKVVALGEIGLDYHYDFSPRATQQQAFERQLDIARGAQKPVVIHTREAWRDTVETLRRLWVGSGLSGIFHCFSGGPTEAGEALDLGFYISYAGIVTFPKAETLREALKQTPLDRLLLETDAPYLAPAPYRGKRNEPAYMVETARFVAGFLGLAYEELAAITTRNWRRLCLQDG
jgi:TatD DNase family protein